MKVLVTGGSGNVGTVVVNDLMSAGHDVTVFDLREPRTKGCGFVEGSVTKPHVIDAAAHGMDAIVHLAAIPAFRAEIPSVDFMKVNVTGTFNVLEAAGRHGAGHVVLASSDSALGFVFSTHPFAPDYFPIDEAHPLRPQDPYGLSKLLGEELCKSATRKYHFRTTCLRFCWVWFENTYPQRPTVIACGPKALAKTMWGYVDVRDAARACRLALQRPVEPQNDAFFITAADTFMDTSSFELIRTCYPEVSNVSAELAHGSYGSLFDLSRARQHLGYVPQFSWRSVCK